MSVFFLIVGFAVAVGIFMGLSYSFGLAHGFACGRESLTSKDYYARQVRKQ